MRFFDTHCDTVAAAMHARYDFLVRPGPTHVDLPRLLDAGFCAQVFAVFARETHLPGYDLRVYAEEAIATIREWSRCSAGALQLALTASDIRAAAGGGPMCGIIGIEGADPLGERADELTAFFDRGVRLIIPAWGDNAFSGSATGNGGGLTAEGRRLVELAESLGVMVDVSHLSDLAFEQVSTMARRPFIASHSACRALTNIPRNLTDDMIRTLAARGGVVGIPLSPFFLDIAYSVDLKALVKQLEADPALAALHPMVRRRKMDERERAWALGFPAAGFEQVVGHVRHCMQVGGEDSVGLGGDLDGVPSLMQGMAGVEGYPVLAERMRAEGLTAGQVEKVCWRNMARVFADVLPDPARNGL